VPSAFSAVKYIAIRGNLSSFVAKIFYYPVDLVNPVKKLLAFQNQCKSVSKFLLFFWLLNTVLAAKFLLHLFRAFIFQSFEFVSGFVLRIYLVLAPRKLQIACRHATEKRLIAPPIYPRRPQIQGRFPATWEVPQTSYPREPPCGGGTVNRRIFFCKNRCRRLRKKFIISKFARSIGVNAYEKSHFLLDLIKLL